MDYLREPAILNNHPGRVLRNKYPKPNKKSRRHSGRTTILCDDKDYPVMFDTYDEWINYRDGMRDWSKKRVMEIKEEGNIIFYDVAVNKKIKKQLAIRRARKLKLYSINDPVLPP